MEKSPQKQSAAVLIIDDEADIRRLLQRLLAKYFEPVHAAEDLKSGTAQLLDKPPRILILDDNLPDGSGIEHIAMFKKLCPDVKIISISALHHLGDRALENGAFVFLEKPLVPEVLLGQVFKAMEG